MILPLNFSNLNEAMVTTFGICDFHFVNLGTRKTVQVGYNLITIYLSSIEICRTDNMYVILVS